MEHERLGEGVLLFPPLSGMVNENIQNGMQNLEPKAEALPLLGMSSFFPCP